MSDDAYADLIARLQDETYSLEKAASGGIPPNPYDDTPSTTFVRLMAREVLRLATEKRIAFVKAAEAQIREVEASGTMSIRGQTAEARGGTLLTLLALTLRQRASSRGKEAPFFVLSLFRARGGNSPHDHGLGIDITCYDGHSFMGPSRDAAEGLLMLVCNLPSGIFEFGLPRAPHNTREDFEKYNNCKMASRHMYIRQCSAEVLYAPEHQKHSAPNIYGYSEGNLASDWAGPNYMLQPDLPLRRSPSGGRGLAKDTAYFVDQNYARAFLHANEVSEGKIRLLFPDEPNHVHITVDIDNAWTQVQAENKAKRATPKKRVTAETQP